MNNTSITRQQIQLPIREHLQHPWQVHGLLSDFEVEDVWRFPVVLGPEHDLHCFRDQLMKGMKRIEQKGPAALLFRFRMFLGRTFGWDEEVQSRALLEPGSLRERYAKSAGLPGAALPEPGNGEFVPVYDLGTESLSEIENATVHAALHLGRIPLEADRYGVQMTVYVKPKGLLGRFYMALIKPFRLWIVYPAMMRMVAKQWDHFLAS